jgi:hypothetical protein
MAYELPTLSNVNTSPRFNNRDFIESGKMIQESLRSVRDREIENQAYKDREEALERAKEEDEFNRNRLINADKIAQEDRQYKLTKEANTADALNLLYNRDAFIENKISGEINAARAGIANLEGQDKIDAQNQLDEYIRTGTELSGKQWESNALNASNVDAGALISARLNKEKLENDRKDRAEDLRWKEKEYNLSLAKARMSGEPKYKGQVYTDPNTGAFVTTRSPEEERVLAQSGWSFGRNPNAGKTTGTGGTTEKEKDYSAGYKKLEERVSDYGAFDNSTAIENLEMLKMFKINPNDVESMLTKIEANTLFDKTLRYKDMNEYGPKIKSSDGKLLPLGDALQLAKKEGYITVLENGKPVLYKPNEIKAIEEKTKEVEKPSKAPEGISQKDIAVKNDEGISINNRFISGVPQELITGNRSPSVKKVDPVDESYALKSDAFKRDVSESEYRKNKQAYDNLYELRYK